MVWDEGLGVRSATRYGARITYGPNIASVRAESSNDLLRHDTSALWEEAIDCEPVEMSCMETCRVQTAVYTETPNISKDERHVQ